MANGDAFKQKKGCFLIMCKMLCILCNDFKIKMILKHGKKCQFTLPLYSKKKYSVSCKNSLVLYATSCVKPLDKQIYFDRLCRHYQKPTWKAIWSKDQCSPLHLNAVKIHAKISCWNFLHYCWAALSCQLSSGCTWILCSK